MSYGRGKKDNSYARLAFEIDAPKNGLDGISHFIRINDGRERGRSIGGQGETPENAS